MPVRTTSISSTWEASPNSPSFDSCHHGRNDPIGLGVSSPRMLFDGPYPDQFDIAPDGQRFLMIQLVEPEQPVTEIEGSVANRSAMKECA